MASLVTVQALNGTLEVPFDVITMSVTIKQMMDDLEINEENAANMPIPITQVDHEIFQKIVEWCTYHKDGNNKTLDGPLCPRHYDDEEVIQDWIENKKLQEFDRQFVEAMKPDFLLQVLKDANYLHVKGLVEVVSYRIAEMMTVKSESELETDFGIINDQTPEGRKAIDDEVAWLTQTDTPNDA